MSDLIEQIRKDPSSESLPEFDRHATVATFQEMVAGRCFDERMNFRDFAHQITHKKCEGKNVHVNTVRHGEKYGDTPIGNLWWLAVAKLHQLHGANVRIVDFYNDPPSNSADIEQLCKQFDFDPKATSLYRAEDFPFDEDLFSHICHFVEQNRSAIDSLEIFPQIREGFTAVKNGDYETAKKHLKRLVEELKVFLLLHDSENGELLLNHERVTPSLIKTMYPEVRKRIVQIPLPKGFNEFRGGKCSVGQIPLRFKRGGRNQDPAYHDMVTETLDVIAQCEKIDFERKGGLARDPINIIDSLGGNLGWHHSKIYNTRFIIEAIALDGITEDPDIICDLISSNGQRTKMYKKENLDGPFSMLANKKRRNPKLLAQTYLRFLQRTINSEGFTHHCVFNPLLDVLTKLDEQSRAECAQEIATIKQLLEDRLQDIQRITVKATTLKRRPQKVNFVVLDQKLSAFLGKPVNLQV